MDNVIDIVLYIPAVFAQYVGIFACFVKSNQAVPLIIIDWFSLMELLIRHTKVIINLQLNLTD